MLPLENIQDFWIQNLSDLRTFLLQNVGAAEEQGSPLNMQSEKMKIQYFMQVPLF